MEEHHGMVCMQQSSKRGSDPRRAQRTYDHRKEPPDAARQDERQGGLTTHGQRENGTIMDIDSVIGQVNALVYGQLRLAGEDPAVEAAGEAILAAIEPAIRQAGMSLAEQAAAEVGAQIPDRKVDVVLTDGQPSLVVRESDATITVSTDELDARMTVRLPENLKDDIESAAQDLGDSVNTFVVRALAGTTRASKTSSRATFEGTIET